MRILVVDDDPFMTEILKLYLARAGYETDTAENGLEALRLLESGTYDVVVTDAVMPGMTGFELCGTVRKRYPHIRIIGMTGAVNVSDFEKAGAHACFYKPVPFRELHKAIQRLCQEDSPAAM
ncbi:MAG TPA: response regulator [Syntrophales bacterium]|nr:response regulator [Syntrophales bacterium]HNS54441.1 response regulator [Syntrophales bacterium]HQL90578.1 response regulator [Syntrophales bacterium]